MKTKKTFLNQSRPLLVCMIQATNPTDAINTITDASYEGADAFGFQMEQLRAEDRTDAGLRSIFSHMGNKPIYATNYRGNQNAGKTDDELAEGLMFLLKNGANLLDVMGDYYCPHPIQITEDPAAVEKQKALIERIHEAGGEVLMSSHVMKFLPAEEVLRIALLHKERGADIAKIVTAANSEEEEIENLRTVTVLKKELGIPFLFLAGGSHHKFLRTIGPMMGSCMWLTVHEYDALATKAQPNARAIRQIVDNFDWEEERKF